MRKWKSLLASLIFISSLFVSCEKIDDGKYVKPITLYEKVNGEWKLNDVVQIDETAKLMGISPDEISLYDQFDFSNFKIKLEVDENEDPTSYKVLGDSPELFAKQGFWELNSDFPASSGAAPIVNLYSDAAKSILVGQLSVSSVPGSENQMELKLTRKNNGVPFVTYQYKLSNVKE